MTVVGGLLHTKYENLIYCPVSEKTWAIENPVCMYIYIWMFIAGEIMCKRQIFQPEPLYHKIIQKKTSAKGEASAIRDIVYIYISVSADNIINFLNISLILGYVYIMWLKQ